MIEVQEILWERAEPINTTSGTASSPVSSNCADILFINLHPTDTYFIDGLPLPPSATFTDGCNVGEWNTHVYQVQGPAPTLVAGVPLGLYVKRKKYGRKIKIN